MATQLQLKLTSAEARGIAKEAYVYGFPLVDNYRIQYAYFENRSDPEYKGLWNQLVHTARVYTPDDTAVQTPNSDTPYSFLGADLRTEPLVLTFAPIESNRYFSAQFVDAYTFNFAYIGTRTTGNDGGSYLLAGPGWKGEKPANIRSVIQCETQLAFVLYRTQLFRPGDIDNVKRVQSGYKVQALSQFLGRRAPPQAPPIDFITPLTAPGERASLEFFNILNFVLQFCPTHPSETELSGRLGEIGVGAHLQFSPTTLTSDVRKAMQEGMIDAWHACRLLGRQLATGELTSADLFGTRAYLKNIYLYRMLGAVDGIYGNSKEEAFSPVYLIDSSGAKLDASSNHYTLRFPPGQFPPANAFWSLTMYSVPSRLLVENPINRYLINSPMLPELQRDRDGGLTIYVQHEQPSRDREANWLPAPKGPFMLVLRLYLPKPEAYNSKWTKPLLLRRVA
ncbi:MAG TPA: DUF1254 domain-containing protein [Gemmatimonadaceae bacterium]|jgi:hypothetical protein